MVYQNKMRLIFLFIVLQSSVFISLVNAQNQNNIWYFGNGYGLDFNGAVPVLLSNGQTFSALEGTATICNASGDLLFYTDGMSVWDRNHNPMPNGGGLLGGASSTHSAQIAPYPGDVNRYYLFTVNDISGGLPLYSGFNYSIVNMTLNGGLGDIEPANKNINLSLESTEKLVVTCHSNGTDLWVINRGMNEYRAYQISSNGINNAPVITPAANDGIGVAYMKISPDGTKMANSICSINNVNFETKLELLDFDNSTGQVNLMTTITKPGRFSYGVEFSENNEVVYWNTKVMSGPSILSSNFYQYDLSIWDAQSVINSEIPFPITSGSAAMQLAPDGKIYIHGSSIDVINDPNILGGGCNYQAGIINLPLAAGNQTLGFPVMLHLPCCDVSVNLGSDTTFCNGVITLDAGSPGMGFTYLWQNNDTSQVIDINSSGSYSVTVSNGVCSQTDTVNITMISPPLIDLGSDTTLCSGTLTLEAENPGSDYEWQDGSTNQTFTLTSSGTYWVTVDNGACTTTDSIDITIVNLDVELGPDTAVCTPFLILDAGNPGSVYEWQDGSTNQTFEIISPGEYFVNIVNGHCTDTDTIIVDFIKTVAQFYPNDTIGCFPQFVSFTDESFTNTGSIVDWLWEFGDNSSSPLQNPIHNYTSSGIYEVKLTVTTDLGCSNLESKYVEVTIYDQPIADFIFQPNPAIEDEEVFFINQSIDAENWHWEFGDNSSSNTEAPSHIYTSTGKLTTYLVAYNEHCSDTAWCEIQINEELIYYVPNTFTPDGDQYNTTFHPVFTKGYDPYDYSLKIFDRWGEILFESNNTEIGWDGTYKGQILQNAVYIWQIEFKETMTDKRQSIIGHVNLLR